MIVDWKIGNVLDGPERHLAFPVNCEGKPGFGLAGDIADNIMPELHRNGPMRLGTILQKEDGDKILHALVIHSLKDWADAPETIEACFNRLEIATDEEIATVTMGGGAEGQRAGASVSRNLGALARSSKRIVVYSFS